MLEFAIIPHHGVGPIHLGMIRSAVHAQFGEPEFVTRDRTREAFLRGFLVDFDKEDHVEFIELAKSMHFRAVFEGKCLHDLPADDAVAFVSQFAAYDANRRELGHMYIFPALQLSLWRGTVADPDDERQGRYFEAVGVAVDGYFS